LLSRQGTQALLGYEEWLMDDREVGKTMTRQRILVRALEQLVHIWSDFWFLADLRNKMLRQSGQPLLFAGDETVPPTKDFRTYLLGLHEAMRTQSQRAEDATVSVQEVDSLYGWPPSLPRTWVNKNVAYLPTNMTCWTLHSRRLYELSAELQGLLRAT